MAFGPGCARCCHRAGVGDLSLRSSALLRQCQPVRGGGPRLGWASSFARALLVVDAEAITNVDYTAARMVRQLHQELVRRGVVLAFARASFSLKADLSRHRLTDVIGPAQFFGRLHDALAAFTELSQPASQIASGNESPSNETSIRAEHRGPQL
jgi:hypothetical protein